MQDFITVYVNLNVLDQVLMLMCDELYRHVFSAIRLQFVELRIRGGRVCTMIESSAVHDKTAFRLNYTYIEFIENFTPFSSCRSKHRCDETSHVVIDPTYRTA